MVREKNKGQITECCLLSSRRTSAFTLLESKPNGRVVNTEGVMWRTDNKNQGWKQGDQLGGNYKSPEENNRALEHMET